MVLFLCKMNILTFLSPLPYVFVTCFNCFNGVLIVARIICSAVGCFHACVCVILFVLGVRVLFIFVCLQQIAKFLTFTSF